MISRNKHLILGLLLTIILSSCQSSVKNIASTEQAIYQTDQAALVEALLETAIFETQVIRQMTAMAPTATHTPTPTLTFTPSPTYTETIEPVVKSPWALQDECSPYNSEFCIKYTINHTVEGGLYGHRKTVGSLHVSLKNTSTGEEGYFVVGHGTTATILLVPGMYRASYYMECGEENFFVRTWLIEERTERFICQKKKIVHIN